MKHICTVREWEHTWPGVELCACGAVATHAVHEHNKNAFCTLHWEQYDHTCEAASVYIREAVPFDGPLAYEDVVEYEARETIASVLDSSVWRNPTRASLEHSRGMQDALVSNIDRIVDILSRNTF